MTFAVAYNEATIPRKLFAAILDRINCLRAVPAMVPS